MARINPTNLRGHAEPLSNPIEIHSIKKRKEIVALRNAFKEAAEIKTSSDAFKSDLEFRTF
jgi:hypothetical protein